MNESLIALIEQQRTRIDHMEIAITLLAKATRAVDRGYNDARHQNVLDNTVDLLCDNVTGAVEYYQHEKPRDET